MHRLCVSAWPGDVYLKSYRPSCTFFGYIPGLEPRDCAKSAMGSAVVGVHRHHESAIPTLLAPCGGRVIHRTFRKRSLCVNGSRALFPDRVVQFGAPVWRNVRKARHFAVSAHRRSDPAKIDREAPPNGAFERFWGPMYTQNQGCTQKTYNVVGYILDTFFLTTLTSAVYANSSSQQL